MNTTSTLNIDATETYTGLDKLAHEAREAFKEGTFLLVEPDVQMQLIALARAAYGASGAQGDTLTQQSLALLRKGLRDWDVPENRYAAQQVLDAIERQGVA